MPLIRKTTRTSELAGTAAALAFLAMGAPASAAGVVPLASHRAAYELSLTDPASPPSASVQTPIAASGLIAYEFRGSACEGYTSSFRQMTQMDRNEGDPISMEVNATSFEDPDGKSMRFRVATQGEQLSPAVSGIATRSGDDDLQVQLTQPATKSIHFGHAVLFPTQHIERLIEAAKAGGGAVQARVYDGSDTGSKIFATMAIVGKETKAQGEDDDAGAALKDVRSWPVVVSYFDEASKDSAPEYTLSFRLYENGVSGSLKLDYGNFALHAHLKKLEILPTVGCAKP